MTIYTEKEDIKFILQVTNNTSIKNLPCQTYFIF